MARPSPSHVDEIARPAFTWIVVAVACMLVIATWRVFVAHADGRRAPPPGRQHGQRVVRHDAPRGVLVDRAGRVLASSSLAYDIEIECYGNADLPRELAARIVASLELGQHVSTAQREEVRIALELPSEERRRDLWQRADQRGTPRGPWQFYWKRVFARDVGSTEVLRALEALGRERFDACRFRFRFESVWNRVYPLGRAAAHVVGTIVGEADGASRAIGLEALDELDAGKPRLVRESRNARGKTYLRDLEVTPFADEFEVGRVVTTLDGRVQEVAFEAIERAVRAAEAEWGLLFLIDLHSGDVLALAGAPTFDPEFRVEGDSDWPMTHWARVEPGSVIKPLILGLAMERGLVQPGQGFVCGDDGERTWRMQPRHARGRRVITDDHYVGECRLEDILIQSSNIGAVKVGMLGGAAFHREMLELFRLAEAPDLGLPLPRAKNGEARRGRVPTARNFEYLPDYELYTGPSLSFGYQLEIYPLSFARAFASLITGHDFHLRLIVDAKSQGEKAGRGRRLFSDRTVEWVRETLVRVVTDPRGTARDLSDAETDSWLAGKTGTTVNRITQTSNASFIGFAPASDPRWLSMALLMKRKVRSFYGGKYAAPAVKELLSFVRQREVVQKSHALVGR